MDWRKIILGILVALILLIVLSFEAKGCRNNYKIKVPIPYRMTIIDKEKYGLRNDIVVYNEMAVVPEKFYTEEYGCEDIRRHLFNKVQLAFRDVKYKLQHSIKTNSPLNALFNNIMHIRRAFGVYDGGTAEHSYYIRALREDYNEVFIYDNFIYIF